LVLRITDPDQALGFYRRSYNLLIAANGNADGPAAVLLQNIGSLHRRARRYQEAKEAYEQALPTMMQQFGEQDPHVGILLGNLGNVYRSLGEYARALEFQQRGLDIDISVSGAGHRDVGIDWMDLARTTDKLGDVSLAVERVDKAIEIFKERLPAAHPLRIQAANTRAGFLIELGRLDEAHKMLGEFAPTATDNVETRRSILNGVVMLADIERLEKNFSTSQALAERVLADPAILGDPFLESDARWARAYALVMQNKTQDALAERERALKLETSGVQGPTFPGVFAEAKYYVCAGDSSRAIAILRAAVAEGFRDPFVLRDPAFASFRERAEFAPIAAALAFPRPPPPRAAQ
jgi:tetratricopeptide (TPR) repeat protein